jgi:hypothetical protein
LCAVASRGHAAFHLLLNALHRTSADAALAATVSIPLPIEPDALFERDLRDPRARPRADDAVITQRLVLQLERVPCLPH